jgi:hypothetical protein
LQGGLDVTTVGPAWRLNEAEVVQEMNAFMETLH